MMKGSECQAELFIVSETAAPILETMPAETIQKIVGLLGELLLKHEETPQEAQSNGGEENG